MTYIQQTLAADETLLAEGKISKWSLFHIYCAAVIFGVSIICLPISAMLLLYAWLKIRSTEMGITSKRVIRKSGVIMRDTSEIRLSKVESVSVKQGFLGRVFGYGDVIISGSGGNDAVMKGVKDPLAFRARVDAACERRQEIELRVSGIKEFNVDPSVFAAGFKQGGAA
jgi:uncharacterized membrane protein YdbT with pleckstrin-like domain